MRNYVNLANRVLLEGEPRVDRTGVGTLSIFGGSIEFDLRERFPLVTSKETRWRTAFLEMLWFLRGEPHVHFLRKHGSKLWDAWADAHGNLGPVYGCNWRRWRDRHGNPIDQMAAVIESVKSNPQGRRHIVSAWNVAELPEMALPPCHWAHQLYAGNAAWLDMQVYQRSWDLALGAPFNIAQYALLLHLYARATGRIARRLTFSYGDAHIYLNHVDAMKNLTVREDNAKLSFHTDNIDIDGYKIDDFRITDYNHGPFIKLDVAV